MTSQMITYVQKKYWVWKAFQGTHRHTHNTLESLHIYYMGNNSNYLIIIHHLRSFENYAFVVDTHNDVHISSFHFVHREELAMKIGLTEARIQVSLQVFFSILLWAPYFTNIHYTHTGPRPKHALWTIFNQKGWKILVILCSLKARILHLFDSKWLTMQRKSKYSVYFVLI